MAQYKAGDVLLRSQPFGFVILANQRWVGLITILFMLDSMHYTIDPDFLCKILTLLTNLYAYRPFCLLMNLNINASLIRQVICSYCWSRLVPGVGTACEGCGLARYCGEECKVSGEEEHEEECAALGRAGTGRIMLSDQLRLVAKIWLKIRKNEGITVEQAGSISNSWAELMDHREELMNDSEELLLAQYNALGSVMKKADMPPMDKFVEIYGKILTNSFCLRSDR